MDIEVIYALPQDQTVVELKMPEGATVLEAITQSGLMDRYQNDSAFKIIPGETPVGIYGERVAFDEPLEDGDRVEIYRPLLLDPMEARRARANNQSKQQKKRN